MADGDQGSGGIGLNRSLQETSTWALALVCFVFIFFGIFIEHLIHLTGRWLKKHKKVALSEAMEKLKSVLMQLGFMSLILTVTQRSISKICVSDVVANHMLPCLSPMPHKTYKDLIHFLNHGRGLAAASPNSSDYCGSKGKISLISEQGINQLNILIFVLAAMQIFYSVATMGLGRAKMKKWKSWEKETQTVDYTTANDPERFRLTRQTTFWQRHVSSCATHPMQLWIKCFFRQFFHSVAKIDYFTLRHGFITEHMSTNNSFDFRKYIQRSLEDDFKAIVGISPIMWFTVVVFLFVDVHGWNIYFWVSFLPLTIVLFVGTKLEVIVAGMAVHLPDRDTVIKGIPLVRPDDNLFWFGRPHLVLTLLHFTLFLNSFEIAFFAWVTWQFGINSCYHENVGVIVVRIVLAVLVQVMCGYITLPLYALVTQMGSHYKNAILEEHTVHAIQKWHANVKEKRKNTKSMIGNREGTSMVGPTNTNPSPSGLPPHRRAPTLSELDCGPHGIAKASEIEQAHDDARMHGE